MGVYVEVQDQEPRCPTWCVGTGCCEQQGWDIIHRSASEVPIAPRLDDRERLVALGLIRFDSREDHGVDEHETVGHLSIGGASVHLALDELDELADWIKNVVADARPIGESSQTPSARPNSSPVP